MQNKFDFDGKSLEIGLSAEEELKKIAKTKNISIVKSSKEEDMYDHFDYYFNFKETSKKIEVKAMKKISRNDIQQSEWIWVEFRNVCGYPGWIYGKSDLVAFELKNHFIFVDRKELVSLCESIVDTKTIVKSPDQAKYKGYRRWNRPKELTAMINISDIKGLSYKKIWKKV
jgi:hypothetical protein